MGWSGGGEIADRLIRSAQRHISNCESRFEFYKDMINALENEGWDNACEMLGIDLTYDKAYLELNPRRQKEIGDGRITR